MSSEWTASDGTKFEIRPTVYATRRINLGNDWSLHKITADGTDRGIARLTFDPSMSRSNEPLWYYFSSVGNRYLRERVDGLEEFILSWMKENQDEWNRQNP